MNIYSNMSLRDLKQRLDLDLASWEAELFPSQSDEEIDREMRAFGINPERAVRKMRATIASFAPKTNWITYTLDQIKAFWKAYQANNLVLQDALRGGEQSVNQIKIDLDKQIWIPIRWMVVDNATYLQIQCWNPPYPTSEPAIEIQDNGTPITPLQIKYNAKSGIVSVTIPKALPANENMQLRIAPNNSDSTELVIDVCSIT